MSWPGLLQPFQWRAILLKRFKAFQIRFPFNTEEQSKRGIPHFPPSATLFMIYGRWWKAISKSIKYVFTQVLIWGKLLCLPTLNWFARFQFKQQIATVTQTLHMPCMVTYVKTKVLFGCSRIHWRANWQVSTASGHPFLPHLNIVFGIYSVSFHKQFQECSKGLSVKGLWGILSFQLDSKFYQKI